MFDNDPVSSAEQDSWTEICNAVRLELHRRAEHLKDMDLTSLQTFVYMCQTALANEFTAKNYDHRAQTFDPGT